MFEDNFENKKMPSLIDGLFGSEEKFNILLGKVKAHVAKNDMQLNEEVIVKLLIQYPETPRMTSNEQEKLKEKIAKIIINDKQREKILRGAHEKEIEDAIRSGDYVDERDVSNVKKEEKIPKIKEIIIRDDHEV